MTGNQAKAVLASSGATKSKKGEATRARILDAAETLFSENGFHGTAIRDVAAAAEVEQGLLSYYFKSKSDLFKTALDGCCEATLGVQAAALKALLEETPAPTVEAILHTYTESALGPLSRGDRRFVNIVKLSAQYRHLAVKPDMFDPIAVHYEPVRESYVRALRKALPQLTPSDVRWGFKVFEAAYMNLLVDFSHEQPTTPRFSAQRIAELRSRLAGYCAAGFDSLILKSGR